MDDVCKNSTTIFSHLNSNNTARDEIPRQVTASDFSHIFTPTPYPPREKRASLLLCSLTSFSLVMVSSCLATEVLYF